MKGMPGPMRLNITNSSDKGERPTNQAKKGMPGPVMVNITKFLTKGGLNA